MHKRIKELRSIKGMSQTDFSNAIGLKSRATIGNIEKGRTNPSDTVKARLCYAFNVRPDWLEEGALPMFDETTNTDTMESLVGDISRAVDALQQLTKGDE